MKNKIIQGQEKLTPARAIDYHLFDKVLNRLDLTKLNMLQVCKEIYDATYIMYKSEWMLEWAEVERLSDVVVKKNMEIDRLNGRIAELTLELEKAGVTTHERIDIPEKSPSDTEKDTSNLLLCEGSEGN